MSEQPAPRTITFHVGRRPQSDDGVIHVFGVPYRVSQAGPRAWAVYRQALEVAWERGDGVGALDLDAYDAAAELDAAENEPPERPGRLTPSRPTSRARNDGGGTGRPGRSAFAGARGEPAGLGTVTWVDRSSSRLGGWRRRQEVTAVLLGDLLARLDAYGLHEQIGPARQLHDHIPTLAARSPASAPTGAAPLPVLEQLDDALRHAERYPGLESITEALWALTHTLPWTQTQSYRQHPPHHGFLDRYAHATILGPPDGGDDPTVPADPHRPRHEASLGAVLLGAHVTYPPHQHPADEVYLPLGPADWLHAHTGRWREHPPGELIHHRPRQPHGMTTHDAPVLLVYLWTGDVRSPSTWCP